MYYHLATDLVKIFNENAYLSIVLDNAIQKLKLNDQDKKIYTKILYGVTENRLLLDYYLSPLIKGKRVKPLIKNTLRIGAYVIDNMNIKDYFIVNELVKGIKKSDYKSAMFINGVLRNYERTQKRPLAFKTKEEELSVKLSLPLDLTKLLYKQYKDELKNFFNNQDVYNSYRINTLKKSITSIIEYLKENNISYKLYDTIIITKEALINTPLFKEGYIIAQDYSSARVATVVNPFTGATILDTCSAPGGKSLHMASLINNEGEITACDIYETRLAKIKENALNLGATCIKTLLADATSYDYNQLYDFVLCDVPCSGLGVIGHKPDLKYHITLDDIKEINNLQKKIINHASKYVKDGGYLIYSTCTINKQENEWLVKDFLREHLEYQKVHEEIILPNAELDGFYICKLRKETNHE